MTWLTPRVTATPRQVASDHLVEPSSSAPPFTAFIDRAQVVAGYLSLGEFASGLEAFLELLPRLPRTRSAAERHVMQNVCAQLVARVARAVDDRHRVDLLKAWSSSTLSDEHEDVRRVLGAIAAAYGTSFAPPVSVSALRDPFGCTAHTRTDIARALDVIDTRHHDPHFALAEVAHALARSVSFTGRLLRHHTGLTFVALVRARRIRRARELLRDETGSVKEVAVAAGFGHPSQLSREFRRFVGMTPGEYRRETRSD